MKKIIPVIIAFLMLGALMQKQEEEYYVIPDDSIRLRIIANSDTTYNQYIKAKVKTAVETELKKIVETKATIEETRKKINANIDSLKKVVETTLKKENYRKGFTIDYGNHMFPEKEYKGVKYEAGEYESLLITIGKGEGNNWWCVLFPPLCTMEVEEENEVSYRFFIKDLIDKYLLKKES